MQNALLALSMLALVAGSPACSTEFPADLIRPCERDDADPLCGTTCSADGDCGPDLYCAFDGTCTADCSPDSGRCFYDNQTCGEHGRCVTGGSDGGVPDGTILDAGIDAGDGAVAQTCGNGVIEGAEACDDLNTTAGDGCSPGCVVEAGWECASEPSVCTQGCDRVTTDLIVLYGFSAGSGDTVHDISGVGPALDLTIGDPPNVTWIPGGGLSVDADTLIAATTAANKLYDACTVTNELTVEAWIAPDNVTQSGPARIVTFSADTGARNFQLGQSSSDYDFRLATTTNNGTSPSTVAANQVVTSLTHVVYRRDAAGDARIYIDGVEHGSATVDGALSGWSNLHQFALANELTSDRPWHGEYHLVAVYSRALTPTEVSQNFTSGPDCLN